jgi:hypothetical protein
LAGNPLLQLSQRRIEAFGEPFARVSRTSPAICTMRTLAGRTGRRSTNLYLSGSFHREIAMLPAHKNVAATRRYGIIGLKSFQMAIRPRRKDAIMRNG